MVVAVLHPGAMGIAIATSVQRTGATVRCCLARRSDETIERAKSASLESFETLEDALSGADVVLSVCPPHASLDTGRG